MSDLKRFNVIAALGLALCLLAWNSADAQPKPSTAQLTRVTGRVEALKKGQSQWNNVGVGAQFVEGDQIRAQPGASADLSLPDGSMISVAENTRFVVTKLDYDTQSRERLMTFHLVVGKIRANVTRAAVAVARARQSNFLVSTPTGVAAVRGTILVTIFNPTTGQTFYAVFPSQGQPASSASAVFIPLGQPGAQPIVVGANQFVTQTGGNPAAIGQLNQLAAGVVGQLQTAVNAIQPGDAFTSTSITIPALPAGFEVTVVQTTPQAGAPPPVFTPPSQ